MPNDSTATYRNNPKTSTNPFNTFIMILTIFVSDSDSNEEALQGENGEEDGNEGEVDIHVQTKPPLSKVLGKPCCFTYINYTKYQFCYLPNDSTDTYRSYPKNIHLSFH